VTATGRCPSPEADRTSRELARLVDGFGGAGTAYARGWLARVRLNRWAAGLVEDVRSGRRSPPPGSPLDVLSSVTEDGAPLPAKVAAVELVNLLRPTVAVAWPGCDLARALAEHPQWRERVGPGGDPAQREAFVHEVRRLYPLTPALAGKVRSSTRRGEHALRRGQRMVLDVPGTNRDPAIWQDPDTFRPERFLERMPDEWQFVPQGGGRADQGHRCPGEPLTVRLLAETLQRLAARDYVLTPGRTQQEQESARRIPPRADEVLRIVAASRA
jgi:fatty-acid peroxygenase